MQCYNPSSCSIQVGTCTLPCENEIRAEITRLFGRKKSSDKDNITSAESDNDDGTEGRKETIYPGNI